MDVVIVSQKTHFGEKVEALKRLRFAVMSRREVAGMQKKHAMPQRILKRSDIVGGGEKVGQNGGEKGATLTS